MINGIFRIMPTSEMKKWNFYNYTKSKIYESGSLSINPSQEKLELDTIDCRMLNRVLKIIPSL